MRTPTSTNAMQAPPNAASNTTQPTAGTPTSGATDRNMHHKKRANIKIATLNMNGAEAPSQGMDLTDKWSMVNSTIRGNRIAILAIQEMHLDEEREKRINQCFSKNFDLINSSEPDNPITKADVAILINKALIEPQ